MNDNSIEILNIAIGVFIGVNFLGAVLLYRIIPRPPKALLLKIKYWAAILVILIVQGTLQKGTGSILFSHALNFFPLALFCHYIHRSIQVNFPTKFLIYYWTSACLLTLLILKFPPLTLSVFWQSIPINSTFLILITQTIWNVFFNKKARPNQLDRASIIVITFCIIGLTQFSLYRMEPGTHFLVWVAAFTSYISLSILLFCHVIYELALFGRPNLTDLVNIQTEKLKTATKEKDLLLKVVAHDTSNPINTIIWKTKMLLQLNHDPKQTHLIKDIDRLCCKVRFILEYIKETHLGMVQKKIEMGPVSIKHALRETIEDMNELFLRKNITIHPLFEDKVDLFTQANLGTLCNSVLTNILSNILKFTPPEGSAYIDYELLPNGKIKITFKDTGIGIPAEKIKHINEGESILSSHGTMGETGMGLGLLICKNYIDQFDGSLVIESSTNEGQSGTTVHILLNQIAAPL